MYVHLYHGRKDPDLDMENWGTVGSTLGPFQSVHIVYGSAIHMRGGHNGQDVWLWWKKEYQGCLLHEGIYYGDVSIFNK
jgi:hypothetical protein